MMNSRDTADFMKKGTFNEQSFNDDYLSIPESTFFIKSPVLNYYFLYAYILIQNALKFTILK